MRIYSSSFKDDDNPWSFTSQQALEVLKLSNQTWSATTELESLLRCHDQCACVSFTILSRPCPKLASRNKERGEAGSLKLHANNFL